MFPNLPQQIPTLGIIMLQFKTSKSELLRTAIYYTKTYPEK